MLKIVDLIQGGDAIEGNYGNQKIRLIPFSSIGKQNGILIGVKVDKMIIDYKEQERLIEDVIIGIYNKKLTKDGKYSALMGLNVLENASNDFNKYKEKTVYITK